MGKEDVERHCDPMLKNSHNKNVQTIKTNKKLLFAPTSNKGTRDKVPKLEILHVNFLVYHSIPFVVPDHFNKDRLESLIMESCRALNIYFDSAGSLVFLIFPILTLVNIFPFYKK